MPVPRLFPGKPIMVLASGPSLTTADVDRCRGRLPVVAVNDTYRLAPWADVLYACDKKWWETHPAAVTFAGLKYAIEAAPAGVERLKNAGKTGLSTDPASVCTGLNSGYQAINVAVHLGASTVLLLGYDMGHRPDQRTHWFGDHPHGLKKTSPYLQFRELFKTLVEPLKALGVTVINCSRQTFLETFPRQALETALDQVAA